jgi:hypothetical protein
MSRKETTAQKEKKNKNRLKAKEMGLYPSIQKRTYKKKNEEINPNIQKLW